MIQKPPRLGSNVLVLVFLLLFLSGCGPDITELRKNIVAVDLSSQAKNVDGWPMVLDFPTFSESVRQFEITTTVHYNKLSQKQQSAIWAYLLVARKMKSDYAFAHAFGTRPTWERLVNLKLDMDLKYQALIPLFDLPAKSIPEKIVLP